MCSDFNINPFYLFYTASYAELLALMNRREEEHQARLALSNRREEEHQVLIAELFRQKNAMRATTSTVVKVEEAPKAIRPQKT